MSWRLGGPVRTLAESEGSTGAASDRPAQAMPPAVRPGGHLGRYVLLRAIGSGGMGVVYLAYDPQLDRRVALKVLRPTDVEAMGSTRARLHREARSLARLTHPNVVPVFDVGDAEGCSFVAMEFVDGQTLGAWLRAAPRTPRAIAAIFADAGRGLLAAHNLGIVHRDFKPDNVLVGTDGRARVVDFGIARLGEAASLTSLDGDVPRATGFESTTENLELTRAGTVLGTPAYMAPEQHRGSPPTPAADQYSFCVALFEALFGRRPFTAPSPAALLRRKSAAAIELPVRTQVPRWLQRLVVRGLAPDAKARWPSMAEVVEQLERGQRGAWYWPVGIATVALAAVAMVPSRGDPACAGAERVAAVWSPARAKEIGAAFDATGVPYAHDTWTRAATGLGRFADQWQREHDDVCTALRGAAKASAAAFDAQMQCLEARLDGFGALVEVFADIDAANVEHSVTAVADLPAPTGCRDAQASDLPERPEDRRRALEVRRRIARVTALEESARLPAALEAARSILADAEAVGHLALVAEARYVYGSALERAGDYASARTELSDALFEAETAGADGVVARAGIDLVWLEGVSDPHPDRAIVWSRHVATALARRPNLAHQAQLANSLGAIHAGTGNPTQAREEFERALDAFSRIDDGPNPNVATALQNIGISLADEGDLERARDHLERALAMFEDTEGPTHPDVGDVLDALGGVSLRRGDLAAARRQFERALVIRRAALGEAHQVVGRSYNSLGTLHEAEGDHAAAVLAYKDGLAVFERALGEHPLVGATLINYGNALDRVGRTDEAVTTLERALELLVRTVPADHPWIVSAEASLGRVELRRDRLGAAGRWLERARPRCGLDRGLCGSIDLLRARLAVRTGGADARALAVSARAALAAAGPMAATELRETDELLTDLDAAP